MRYAQILSVFSLLALGANALPAPALADEAWEYVKTDAKIRERKVVVAPADEAWEYVNTKRDSADEAWTYVKTNEKERDVADEAWTYVNTD